MFTTSPTQLSLPTQGKYIALVIDHDSINRSTLGSLLESEGCYVIEIENEFAVPDIFHKIKPDIVVLNAMLPESRSFDLCAQIQALPNDPSTPVLMITDSEDEDVVDRALTAGAADYVTLPIRPRILRHRIRRLLQAHQTSMSVIRAKKEWEAAFDAVSDMIILTDLDGKIIRCNRATIQCLESSYLQLVGFNLKEILFKDCSQEFNLTFGKPIEMQLPTLPGWFELRIFPGQVGNRPGALVYVLKDITERKQLEENLQKSEKLFKALVENISEGIELFDADTKVLYASPMVARMLGVPTAADLVGLNPMADIHPDDLEPNLARFTQLLQQAGGSFTTEMRTKHANGSWIWVEANVRNLLYEPGINAILVNFRDITKRKQTELKLRQLSQAVEQSPISIVITDPVGNIEYVNPRFSQLTGYTFEEVVGKNPRCLKSGQTRPETYAQLWDALLAGHEWQGEFINRKKNGEIFIERASVSPVLAENGVVTHFLALKEDITEQKRAEETLRISEANLSEALQNTKLAYWEYDISRDEFIFNDHFYSIFHTTVEQEAGYRMSSAHYAEKFCHPEDMGLVRSGIEKALNSTGRQYHTQFDHRILYADGGTGYISVRVNLDRDEQGHILRYYGANQDITDRKRAEAAIAESEERLRLIVETIPVPIVISSATDGSIFFVNSAMSDLLDIPKQELLNKHTPDFYFNPAERSQLLETLRRDGKLHNYELTLKKSDQTPFWALISMQSMTFANQPALFAALYDITERKQAEEALRLSEERFQLVTHATNNAVWDLNLSTGEIWWNRGIRTLFGYKPETGLNRAWWEEHIHPDDRSKVLNSFEEALAGDGEFWSKEYRFCRADGTYAYIFDRGYIMQDEQGRPVRVIGAIMDLTDRKQSEEALRRREQQLEEAQQIAHLGSWEWDAETNSTVWSKELYQLYGYDPQSPPPDFHSLIEKVIPEDREQMRQEGLSEHEIYQYDYRITVEGEVRWLHARAEMTYDQAGKPLHMRGITQDITERKHMEQVLRNSEEVFSKAFHASPAPMTITRVSDGVLIDVNRSWERLLDYQREMVIGISLFELNIIVTPNDRLEIIRCIREQGRVDDYEIRARKQSGEEVKLLQSAQIIEIQGQDCLMSAFYDITELQQMHELMLASQKLADLGTLAAGVAHEMNSPLQVITGLSQSMLKRLADNRLAPEQLQHNLDVIQRNGWRCAEIVRSLHTYARNSSGSMESTDLNELVTDGLLLIEHQLKSWANISVRTVLAEELPLLKCDRNQITQVLINILTNARDAMPNGGEITVATGHDSKSDQLILQISDVGIGIPDSIRSKIFDPFFTTKPLGKGTGLGLSIVAGIVRAHGGTIEVNNALPQGTTFTARFPVKPIKLPDSDPNQAPGRFDNVVNFSLSTTEQTQFTKEPSYDQNSSR